MSTGKPSEAAIRATIQRYVRAFTERNRSLWLEVFAPDAVQEDPIGERRLVGLEQVATFWDMAFQVNDAIDLQAREIYVCHDEAALVWTIRETRKTGDREFSGVDVFRFDGAARITSVRAFWQRDLVRRLA